MSKVREAAGGGRIVEVSAQRLPRWCERFQERHGALVEQLLMRDGARHRAADGALAEFTVPFAPLATVPIETASLEAMSAHLAAERTVGLVLVRRGAHSVGIARHAAVVEGSTDRRLVQGRSAAGGWSQQRFARRRQGQARESLRAASATIRRVLGERELDAVVLGGDRSALSELMTPEHNDDRVVRRLLAGAEPRVLDVGEPRRAVLEEAARRAWTVEIHVREPGE